MLNSRDPVYPPRDGTVYIPETIEFNWKHKADHPAFVYSEDNSDHITEISNLEFGRACHRAAYALRPGCVMTTRPTIGFIALTDVLLYQAIVMGLMRANMVPFPISPRNTPAGIASLLMKTSSHHLVATCETLPDLIKDVKAAVFAKDPMYELTIEELPALDIIFPRLGVEREEDPFIPYPAVDPRPAISDVCMFLHSSGSTGPPKIIPQSHEMLLNLAEGASATDFCDFRPCLRLAAMHLPSFHAMGFRMQILYALRSYMTIAIYPPVTRRPDQLPIMPTPQNILDHTRRTKSNGIITIPSILQVWSQDPKSVDILKDLQFVIYAGGGICSKIGDFLYSSGIKLYSCYGTTESSCPSYAFKRKKEDEAAWEYIEFTPQSNVRWIPEGDGTYECQFQASNTHILAVENLRDIRGYATSDLFIRHPTKDYLWKFVGRKDDVVVHSSGEKTVPAPMEDVVMSSPYVMGVIVFGQAHNQAGILIEPKVEYAIDREDSDQDQLIEFRNLLWPIIEEANKVAPAFSRIFKEMILVTHKDKPLPRAGKGTVMRKAALNEYHDEIETLYATVEDTQKTESIEPPALWDRFHIAEWLLKQARELNSDKNLSGSVDIFEQGFDSLSATILRRRITAALQSTTSETAKAAAGFINQNTVYTHPTVDRLTNYLVTLIVDPNRIEDVKSHVDHIESMITEYSSPWPKVNVKAEPGTVVLLTGSTGNIGSHILEALLRDARILRVYAFNRPSSRQVSLLNRHMERFEDKGFDKGLLASEKLSFVQGDTSQDNLGIPSSVFNELRNSVDVIIHSAWRLDFNLSLSSFDSSVRGTRNLIDFAHDCVNVSRLKFVFASSVASAASWNLSQGPYPEETVLNARFAVGNGYGESKYVSERLLVKAGINSCSLRIGQVSGGYPNGAWAVTDWVPILVKSGLALGMLPLGSGVVSWTPMDAVSKCIVELIFRNERLPPVLNVVHPRPTNWNTIIKLIGEALVIRKGLHSPLSFTSFQNWFDILEVHARAANQENKNELRTPAIKLLDFFRQMSAGDLKVTSDGRLDAEAGGSTKFSTSKMQEISQTMRDLKPLVSEDVERWVKYWDAAGLFSCI